MPRFKYVFHQSLSGAKDELVRLRYKNDPSCPSEILPVKHCSGCKRWVSEQDWVDWCSHGIHEFATEVTLPASAV